MSKCCRSEVKLSKTWKCHARASFIRINAFSDQGVVVSATLYTVGRVDDVMGCIEQFGRRYKHGGIGGTDPASFWV